MLIYYYKELIELPQARWRTFIDFDSYTGGIQNRMSGRSDIL